MIKRFFLSFLLGSLLMPASAFHAAEKNKNDGFKPLFNGKDFSGWYTFSAGKKNSDPNHLFQIHDGMVHMYKDAENGSRQPHGYIATDAEYSNYHLRFQYQWGQKKFGGKVDAKRDAGLLFHVVGPDGVWRKSVECQIQEGDTGDIFTVNTRVTTTVDPATTKLIQIISTNAAGLIKTNFNTQPRFKEDGVKYTQGVANGIKRVLRSQDYEVKDWNTVDVIVCGDSAVYLVNGKMNNKILHLEKMVGEKWVPLTKGKILLQQEGAEVLYRNIEIKMLD